MATDESHGNVTAIALRAINIARENMHEMATLEHILIALLEREEVQKALADLSVDTTALSNLMESFLAADFVPRRSGGTPMKSRDFEALCLHTIGTALFSQRKTPDGLDMLLHMLQFPHEDSFAVTALLRCGLTSLMLKRYLAHGPGAVKRGSTVQSGRVPEGMEGTTPDADPTNIDDAIKLVTKYCTDLNAAAKEGRTDPLIGRETEVAEIVQIIARRTKNNVVLVGEPGVGKTAIAEGLALKIVRGEVPATLAKSTVYSLDVGALVAGTRFRGDFEERMKLLLKALGMIEGAILFIDEIHTIMDAGAGSKGSLDVANLLKPALAKGTLRCIGSTTFEEYRKHFEKDRALIRRFKKVMVDEPSIADAKLILRGLKGAYETYHGVTYTDAAIDAAVELTAKYIHGALLPDKAIDVMDNAGARQRVAPEDQRLTVIDVAQIEAEVSRVAKIPLTEVSADESERLARLEDDLRAAVFGQDKAITTLVDAVFVTRAGLREPNKPAGSYLFAGPTGVGKTEVARRLAKTLGVPLVKFDMSEYMEKHSVSKLIGAPPGYVGYGEGGSGNGLLTNAIDQSPSCVLLLDEIEKAHEDIYNILLQVMDDGRLTNSDGKTVSFRNVILIMTSNAGASAAEKNPIGFGRSEVPQMDDKAIKRTFTPEFRNRLDAVVTFDRLRPENMVKIVDKFLASLSTLAAERKVTIEADDAAREWLAKAGYDPLMGARPLARVIQEHIKKPLSRMMLVGDLKNGGKALVSANENGIVISGAAA